MEVVHGRVSTSPRVTIVIRAARVPDAPWLAALAERMFRETYAAFNTPENMERYVAEHFGQARQAAELGDPGMVTLVAEVDGQPAGYVQLGTRDVPDSVTGADPMEIVRFYVDRPWHGSGLAPALMDAAASAAQGKAPERSGSASGSEILGPSRSTASAASGMPEPRRSCWAMISSATSCSRACRLDSLERGGHADTDDGPAALEPRAAPGRRSWHGGPTPVGAVRGVSAVQAAWRPTPRRKSVWEWPCTSPTGSTPFAVTWRRGRAPIPSQPGQLPGPAGSGGRSGLGS